MSEIDFSTWVAGWTALAFVCMYGLHLGIGALRVHRARATLQHRILVTGTRGKSGTVRIIHAALSGDERVYAKITGTEAAELNVDGVETETFRAGAAGVSELSSALIRAAKQGATTAVIECMAVSPKLIELVQRRIVRAQIVVIPTVRLDHLEEEGLTELDIGMSMLSALGRPRSIICGVTQPHIIEAYQQYCDRFNIDIEFVVPAADQEHIPGQHPTNIALGLAVARRFGISAHTAIERIRFATLEPGAITFARLSAPDGTQLDLVDIGGANDPESAREAFNSWGLDPAGVIPILVNRWERPLRAVSFIGSVNGRFPKIGVIGTLRRWANRLETSSLSSDDRPFAHSEYVQLRLRDGCSVQALADWANAFEPGTRHTLVFLENIHDPLADRVRWMFANSGEVVEVSEEVRPGVSAEL